MTYSQEVREANVRLTLNLFPDVTTPITLLMISIYISVSVYQVYSVFGSLPLVYAQAELRVSVWCRR